MSFLTPKLDETSEEQAIAEYNEAMAFEQELYEEEEEIKKSATLPQVVEGSKDFIRGVLRGTALSLQTGEKEQQRIGADIRAFGRRSGLDVPEPEEGFYAEPSKTVAQWSEAKILEADPELSNPTFVGQIVRAAPAMLGQAVLSVVSGGTLSLPAMYLQISGLKYNDLIQQGVPHDRAKKMAAADGVLQAPMEQLGIGKVTKFVPGRKKAVGFLKKFVKSMTTGTKGAALTEAATEALQTVPDVLTTILANDTDKSVLDALAETMTSRETYVDAVRSGLIGGILGGGMHGAGRGARRLVKGKAPVDPVEAEAMESQLQQEQADIEARQIAEAQAEEGVKLADESIMDQELEDAKTVLISRSKNPEFMKKYLDGMTKEETLTSAEMVSGKSYEQQVPGDIEIETAPVGPTDPKSGMPIVEGAQQAPLARLSTPVQDVAAIQPTETVPVEPRIPLEVEHAMRTTPRQRAEATLQMKQRMLEETSRRSIRKAEAAAEIADDLKKFKGRDARIEFKMLKQYPLMVDMANDAVRGMKKAATKKAMMVLRKAPKVAIPSPEAMVTQHGTELAEVHPAMLQLAKDIVKTKTSEPMVKKAEKVFELIRTKDPITPDMIEMGRGIVDTTIPKPIPPREEAPLPAVTQTPTMTAPDQGIADLMGVPITSKAITPKRDVAQLTAPEAVAPEAVAKEVTTPRDLNQRIIELKRELGEEIRSPAQVRPYEYTDRELTLPKDKFVESEVKEFQRRKAEIDKLLEVRTETPTPKRPPRRIKVRPKKTKVGKKRPGTADPKNKNYVESPWDLPLPKLRYEMKRIRDHHMGDDEMVARLELDKEVIAQRKAKQDVTGKTQRLDEDKRAKVIEDALESGKLTPNDRNKIEVFLYTPSGKPKSNILSMAEGVATKTGLYDAMDLVGEAYERSLYQFAQGTKKISNKSVLGHMRNAMKEAGGKGRVQVESDNHLDDLAEGVEVKLPDEEVQPVSLAKEVKKFNKDFKDEGIDAYINEAGKDTVDVYINDELKAESVPIGQVMSPMGYNQIRRVAKEGRGVGKIMPRKEAKKVLAEMKQAKVDPKIRKKIEEKQPPNMPESEIESIATLEGEVGKWYVEKSPSLLGNEAGSADVFVVARAIVKGIKVGKKVSVKTFGKLGDRFKKAIDIESWFNENERSIALAAKNMHGNQAARQEKALLITKEVKALEDKYLGKQATDLERMDVLIAHENKDYFNSLPPEKQAKYEPIIKYMKEYFDEMKKRLDDAGFKVDFLEGKKRELHEKLGKSKSPHEQEKIREKLKLINQMNFTSIPAGLIAVKMNQLDKGNKQQKANAKAMFDFLVETQKKRTMLRLTDVINSKPFTHVPRINKSTGKQERDANGKAIWDKRKQRITLTPTEVIGSYGYRAAKDFALANVVIKMKRAGMLVDKYETVDGKIQKKKKPKGYASFSQTKHRALQDFYVNERGSQLLDELLQADTSVTGLLGVYDGLNRRVKSLQFFNPFFMLFYNTMQGIKSGNLPSFNRFRENLRKVWDKDAEYLEAERLGLFSKPFELFRDEYISQLEKIVHGGSWIGYPMRKAKLSGKGWIGKSWAFTEGAVMGGSWTSAWLMDNAIRMSTYQKLIKRGYSKSDAAQLAAKFHGDYASVPPKTRRILNRAFFTPTFKIVMAKTYTSSMTALMKQGVRLAKGKGLGPKGSRDRALARNALTIAMTGAAFHGVMLALGFELEDDRWWNYGRSYVRKENNYRVTFSTPHNIVQRWIGAFNKAIKSSGGDVLSKRFLDRALKTEMAILPKIALAVVNNSTYDGSKIYNTYDSATMQNVKIGLYTMKESIAMLRFLDNSLHTLTDKNIFPQGMKSRYRVERERMLKENGKLLRFLTLEVFPFYIGLKTPKERRAAQGIMREFRRFAAEQSMGMRTGVGREEIQGWRKTLERKLERYKEDINE